MLRFFCKSKIHRATVTGADLNYVGSITLSTDLIEAAGLLPYERVQIVNLNNGERFETYVIAAPGGVTGDVCLNGAAARLVQKGDRVIIINYCMIDDAELAAFRPKIIFVDDDNKIIKEIAEEPGFTTSGELLDDPQ